MNCKILTFSIALLLFTLLMGCTVESNKDSNDLNKTLTDANVADSNSPNQNSLIFCQMPEVFKMYYEEKYYSKEGVLGVTVQNYLKQTLDTHYAVDRVSDLPFGVGTWGVATKDNYIVYSNVDGPCTAMRYDSTFNPFLMKEPIYYLIQFTQENKQIGGSEIGWKLKQPENLGEGFDTEIVTLADYISKEYCLPLIQDTNMGDYADHAEKVNFTRDFPDSIFDLPLECKNAPVTNVSISGGGVIGDSFEEDFEEDSDINYSSDSNPCIKQCEEMRTICEAKGLEVTSNGLDCYDPNTEDYQRNCEYVCWSN
jgi:hypothetical protein